MLNWADLHIDGYGNYVSFEERLKDISTRYNVPVENLPSNLMVQELLKKGYSVTDTSAMCGFSDSGYFIKKFASYNKITPLKYQQLQNTQKLKQFI